VHPHPLHPLASGYAMWSREEETWRGVCCSARVDRSVRWAPPGDVCADLPRTSRAARPSTQSLSWASEPRVHDVDWSPTVTHVHVTASSSASWKSLTQSVEDRAVKFACSMGFSDMTDRIVWRYLKLRQRGHQYACKLPTCSFGHHQTRNSSRDVTHNCVICNFNLLLVDLDKSCHHEWEEHWWLHKPRVATMICFLLMESVTVKSFPTIKPLFVFPSLSSKAWHWSKRCIFH